MEITKHPRFRWMAGMLTTTGYRVIDVYDRQPVESGVTAVRYAGYSGEVRTCRLGSFAQEHGSLELTDAATVGCLYETLRGVAGGAGNVDLSDDHHVRVAPVGFRPESFNGANLGEALCAALLTVWGEK